MSFELRFIRRPSLVDAGRRSAKAFRLNLWMLVLAGSIGILFAQSAVAQTATKNGLFQSMEKRSSKLGVFTKWNGVMRRYRRESRRESKNCRAGRSDWCAFAKWRGFIKRTKRLSRSRQIVAVNRYVNRIRTISDKANYGRSDYWATPRQFFARGGDSEDSAIAKYLTFRSLGWMISRLRLAAVVDKPNRQVYTLLVVYHGGVRYILDNYSNKVLSDRVVRRYRPIYSFNERHWWFHTGLKL